MIYWNIWTYHRPDHTTLGSFGHGLLTHHTLRAPNAKKHHPNGHCIYSCNHDPVHWGRDGINTCMLASIIGKMCVYMVNGWNTCNTVTRPGVVLQCSQAVKQKNMTVQIMRNHFHDVSFSPWMWLVMPAFQCGKPRHMLRPFLPVLRVRYWDWSGIGLLTYVHLLSITKTLSTDCLHAGHVA